MLLFGFYCLILQFKRCICTGTGTRKTARLWIRSSLFSFAGWITLVFYLVGSDEKSLNFVTSVPVQVLKQLDGRPSGSGAQYFRLVDWIILANLFSRF
jgi:hypothetical protein